MGYLTVGTAGHVDHGKSTLIKVLTGIDPDRLAEEKKRGLTIDLGFAHLRVEDTIIGFIDVPGHERFLKNMLAGASGFSFVLLIIAANEGIMPQTTEHLQILELLNIKRGAVILSKTDLVENDLLELVTAEIKAFLKGTFLENSPLIKFSAVTAVGKAEIISLLKNLKNENASLGTPKNPAPVVFPVDRVFSKSGFGTIVTGTLNSGEITAGQSLQLFPTEKTVKIKMIQVFNEKTENTGTGSRSALNIPELAPEQVQRGSILVSPGLFKATDSIEVSLRVLPGLNKEIKANSPVKFYHFCSETKGKISFLGKKALKPGEEDFARIKLEKPVIIPHNTPFVIRNPSPAFLVGGGLVLNPYPAEKKYNTAKRRNILTKYKEQKYQEIISDFLAEKNGRSAKPLFRLENLQDLVPVEAWADIYKDLCKAQLIISPGNNFYLSKGYLNNKNAELIEIFQTFHKNYPGKIGISKQELQKICKLELFILEFLINCLKGPFLVSYNNLYFLKGSGPVTSEADLEEFLKIIQIMENEGFQDLKDLGAKTNLAENRLADLLKILVYKNEVEELSGNVFVTTKNWQQIKEKISSLISQTGRITASQAKEHLNTTRKYIIPVMETLDKQKITRRIGDFRVLY
jgi:selenocysteine-specific elongation factor